MARIQAVYRPEFETDQRAAWKSIHDGVVVSSTKTRRKYWDAWVQYTHYMDQSAYQDQCGDDSIVALTGFAARVRSGAYGRRRQVGVQTVTDALGAIATTFKLAGKAPPTNIEAGRYILPLQRQIEAYRRDDPPLTPQLALPVKVAEETMSSGCLPKATPIDAATSELGLTAF